jgi:hypothetical protein
MDQWINGKASQVRKAGLPLCFAPALPPLEVRIIELLIGSVVGHHFEDVVL